MLSIISAITVGRFLLTYPINVAIATIVSITILSLLLPLLLPLLLHIYIVYRNYCIWTLQLAWSIEKKKLVKLAGRGWVLCAVTGMATMMAPVIYLVYRLIQGRVRD